MEKINLIEWLPKYLQEYREIKEIMSVENPEIENLYSEINTILDNQFILHCNEKGIERFEKLLKIIPNSDDNLPGRISRVLTRFNDSIPYTYKGLIQKLNVMCGEGNYFVNLINNEYKLEITVSLVYGGQVDELDYMLSYMIPANIIVKSKNEVINNTMSDILYGGIVTTHRNVEIESILCRSYNLEGKIKKMQVIDVYKENCIESKLHKQNVIVGCTKQTYVLDIFKED